MIHTQEEITYRHYEEKDINQILQLWERDSGWGSISRLQFDSWYVNTLYGKSIIIVAEEENGRIFGQLVFSPTRILLQGREIKALRLSSPILNITSRGGVIKDNNHPVFSMIQTGVQMAADLGFQFIYSYPSIGWLKLFKNIPIYFRNPFEASCFECFNISLETSCLSVNLKECYVTSTDIPAIDYETLWWEAVKEMPINCGIIRRLDWLKRTIGGNLLLETRSTSTNRLIGYVAIKKESGLIIDILTRNKYDLKKVLECSINFSNKAYCTGKLSFDKVKGILTPEMKFALSKIDHVIDNYSFAFGSYLLDNSLEFENLKSSNWYMTLNG